MQVQVQNSDITAFKVSAVVNPANSQGVMDAGIGAVLRACGGDAIQREAMEAAPIAVGAALITEAGMLPARHIIHAPTRPHSGDKTGAENIRRAARAALLAANHLQLKEIAFPGIGPEDGSPDRSEAARAVVEEIRAHKRAFPETVYLVDTSNEMIEAFETALHNAQQGL